MYQSGLTIGDALEAVSKNHHVRFQPFKGISSVEASEQICRLFDSPMQGSPPGTPFLVLKVEPEKVRTSSSSGLFRTTMSVTQLIVLSWATLPNRELITVLAASNGLQQHGAEHRPSWAPHGDQGTGIKWRTKSRTLSRSVPLHLISCGGTGDDDEGEAFRFRFMEAPERGHRRSGAMGKPAPDILTMSNAAKLSQWLSMERWRARSIAAECVVFTEPAMGCTSCTKWSMSPQLDLLHQESRVAGSGAFVSFIRMNLPSEIRVIVFGLATQYRCVAQWSKFDARQEIHSAR
ncbi:MAG: hypothetical protein IPH64_09685 [Comamonadaceae bacterium]|nr:hypothetical protein [Comamonadaceae bacterium]